MADYSETASAIALGAAMDRAASALRDVAELLRRGVAPDEATIGGAISLLTNTQAALWNEVDRVRRESAGLPAVAYYDGHGRAVP